MVLIVIKMLLDFINFGIITVISITFLNSAKSAFTITALLKNNI